MAIRAKGCHDPLTRAKAAPLYWLVAEGRLRVIPEAPVRPPKPELLARIADAPASVCRNVAPEGAERNEQREDIGQEGSMSVQASAWAWTQRRKFANPNAFLVLLALAEHASPTGVCWPSRATIAEMVGFNNKGSVTKNVKLIVDMGLMKIGPRYVEDREGAGKRRTSNEYQLLIDAPLGQPDTPPAPQEAREPYAPASQGAMTSSSVGKEPPVVNHQKEPTTNDADVQRVADHYCEVFKPRQFTLGPNRVKGIERALAETDADGLCLAIDGLHEYRKRKPGDFSLETIWKTFRGTGSLVERIEFFISQAPGSPAGGRPIPSVLRATVQQRQLDVQRGHRLPDSPQAVESAQEAEAWLRQHGIETVRDGGAEPTFRPLTSEPDA